MMIMTAAVLALAAGYLATATPQARAAESTKKLLRVGTYDSRAIAIAYAHSHFNEERCKTMKVQLDAAQAAGDEQKAAEITRQGKADQAQKHLQGFGTAPVHEYLEVVKDQIPAVAKAAGVDLIVSKWQFDYRADNIETVDLTLELAKLFDPADKAWRSIESLDKWQPYPEEKLKQLEKAHPNF